MSNSRRAVSRCCECGEVLYEGDTAYFILGKVLCPLCVMEGEHICGRRSASAFDFASLAESYNIISGKGGMRGEENKLTKTGG